VNGDHASQSIAAADAPKISASHNAEGKPSKRHGSFHFAALHLTQEAIGSPQAAHGFSRFLLMTVSGCCETSVPASVWP
jgi:hypothetical protein